MKQFHIHIYFEAQDTDRARQLAEAACSITLFDSVKLHENPVGPHPTGMIEIHFHEPFYNKVVRWAEAHRGNFSALVHEDTGDDFRDHTEGILWLGPKVNLDFSFFELILKRPELRIHQ